MPIGRRFTSLAVTLGLSLIAWLSPHFSQAAIIGENDWLPLSEAVEKFGLSQAAVDMILDSGGEITCVGENSKGQPVFRNRLVGWVESLSPPRVLTVAHFIYDKHGLRHSNEYLGRCHFASNRAVLAGDDYQRFQVRPDLLAHRLGDPSATFLQGGEANREGRVNDRMLLLLQDDLVGVSALPLTPVPDGTVEVGSEVFIVSAARPFHRHIKGSVEPMVAPCRALKIDRSAVGKPDLIRADCDSFKGVSGSVLFIRSKANPADLVPIALQSMVTQHTEAVSGTPIDGKPADPRTNFSLFVLMDEAFFDFPLALEQPN